MKSTLFLSFVLLFLAAGAQTACAEDVLHIRLAGWEGSRPCLSQISTVGDELAARGVITTASGRLDDLPLGDLWTVNTAAVLIDAIVADFGFGEDFICRWRGEVDYSGGILRIYDNADAAVDWMDPATFADGTLLLEIALSDLNAVYDYDHCLHVQATPMTATGLVTGGSLLGRFPMGERTIGISGMVDLESMEAQDLCPVDGFGFLELDLAVTEAVPVEPASWGRLKRLY